MFDNVILDVCIGLVFLYLLYSLLATTINEFVAMIFAYRHRMLEKAIEQMLDGKNISYYWWDKLANIILWSYQNMKGWISKKHILTIHRKEFFRTHHINRKRKDENKAPLQRVKLNKKASLFASNIINHPQYRRKSENSFLFKKPAYLSSSSFSDILLDILSNRKSCNTNAPLLLNDIKAFVSNKLEGNPDLKSILNFYIQQANGDVQKFQLLIENWYDDTMERVSGWYKRQATKVLFVIGLVLAFTFNVSTIEIIHKLSVNKDLREAMAQNATTYVKQRSQPTSTPPDTGKLNTQVREQIKDIRKLYGDTIASVNMLMGLGWDYANMDTNIRHPYLNIPYQLTPHKLEPYYFKVRYILNQTASSPSKIIGFLITALAITLGAPFWFDLLNKFINIRAGGNKPAEGSTYTTVSKTVTLNQQPAPNSFA